jgi:hypothetical protein
MAVGMLRSAGRGYDASGGQGRFRDAFGDQSMISGRNLPIDAAVPGESRLLNLIKEFVAKIASSQTVFSGDFPIFGKLIRAAAANVFRRAAQDMRRTRTGCRRVRF